MSADSSSPLFSREEALGGMSARKARAVLFLVEYWAARLYDEGQRRKSLVIAVHDLAVYAPILLDDSAFKEEPSDVESDPDATFYQAFQLNREDIPPATSGQIEATAPLWAPVVPEGARLRAQVGRLLLKKYALPESRCPQIRAALGLDGAAVRDVYQSLYREPLTAAYAPAPPGFGDRLRGLFGRK
jgi:hypothetical protein